MNEAETRAEHIDPALKAAGWGVVDGSRVLREHGITLGRLHPTRRSINHKPMTNCLRRRQLIYGVAKSATL